MSAPTLIVMTVWPLTVTAPDGLTATVSVYGVEVTVFSFRVTLTLAATPVAGTPVVASVTAQGETVILAPVANLLPAANVEDFTVKMHDPKVMSPVAVAPPDAMENVGAAVPDVGGVMLMLVDAVVPKSGTPEANTMG